LRSEGLDYAIVFEVPKVKEFFVSLKIDLAKGEHLNFSPACHSHISVIRSA
jgi:hypothetical protein